MSGPEGLDPGVHRLLGPPAEVAAALARIGWRAVTVEPVDSTSAFYDAVAAALDLPAWFGRNLDALWDVLTDLSEPTVIVLAGWTRFATARPDDFSRVLDVLGERTALDPPFAVVLGD